VLSPAPWGVTELCVGSTHVIGPRRDNLILPRMPSETVVGTTLRLEGLAIPTEAEDIAVHNDV
jgi:hypothetical protein